MIEKICCNCKHAEQTNAFYEDIYGQIHPLNVFVAYCPELDCYVVENEHCKMWESCIKTVKVTYK